MARVILPSRAALADFDRIYDFIAPHNSRAAAKVLRALDKAIMSALQAGTVCDEF
jgi:plasmid stabilization system protein ParE